MRAPGDFSDDYEPLERYLRVALSILEGLKSKDETYEDLAAYLEWHSEHGLPPRFKDFLIEIYQNRYGELPRDHKD
jgi:hypothetical protein